MCDAWQDSFEIFISDMGRSPEGHTLDRINVNGNYEPGNCRWATAKQQGNNKRDNVVAEAFGFTGNLKQISERFGINYKYFHSRINKYGDTPEQAIVRARGL